jgi:ribosome-associated protein
VNAASAKKSPAAKVAAKKPVKAKKAAPKTTPSKMAAAAKSAKPSAAKKAPTSSTKLSAQQKTAETLSKQIAKLLDTNKAEDITTLNIREKCSFADYMIVASGRAPRHVSALADYVADMLKKLGRPALSVEGKESGDWVLIDAGDVVVHIFRPEVRMFYNLEKMWAMPAMSV